MYAESSESANLNSFCELIINPVPAVHIKSASPANAPDELYCTCVVEPPGEVAAPKPTS